MTLAGGSRLGPYEIVSQIGAGGMGEVYTARDTRLDRIVAIKVSHEQFTERFDREARAVAALNHPNICSLFDVGSNFLVMEYVEGETLAGPLPLETAIHYARQIAEAIEAAHERGIIHRDLKPANIKVTSEGKVKVLDFGLAKAIDDTTTTPSQNSPTLTLAATGAGMILGTAAYMSPEQAKGKTADRRSDIWAFGVVLYEMLTGKQLFNGETTGDVLAAVIRDEPDFKNIPSAVRPLVERCLIKDPRRRLQAIGEARLMLEEPQSFGMRAERGARTSRLPWIATAVFLLVAAAFATLYFRQRPPERRIVRFQIPPPSSAGNTAQYKLSPDGRYLAFTANEGGRVHLFVRAMDSLEARALPGTDDARLPFWSPDSAWIGFFNEGRLKKISVNGGPAQILCNAQNGIGGTWNGNGIIVFQPGPGNGVPLMRVPQAGGDAVPVTKLESNEGHVFPEFLPDGRHFLYWKRGGTGEAAGIYVGSLDGSSPVRILPDESNAVYVPPAFSGSSGHLLFRKETTLMAQPFDALALKLTGDLFPVAEQVGSAGPQAYAGFTASQNGVLVYRYGGDALSQEPIWMDRTGKPEKSDGPAGQYVDFRLSPDNQSVAFYRAEGSGRPNIWVREFGRNITRKLTFGTSVDLKPTWSTDGLRILFFSNRGTGGTGSFDLYTIAASGAGAAELLFKTGTPQGVVTFVDWSRDSRFVLYPLVGNGTGSDLWVVPQFGDTKPFPYLHEAYNETDATFSPDGQWAAYVSDESGRNEVYVQSFPPAGGKWQISTNDGGVDPQWSSDGTELFYVRVSVRSLMAVPVKLGKTFSAGTPKALFPLPVIAAGVANRRNYAASADGRRFLIMKPIGETAVPPVTVVLNWQSAFVK